ncbi:T9SS type A sorting domain-containing protein [Myroides sp. 1354]|uniref:T9SS type A sorting domain-containing protein n=1 Tax=unclassified Myroides TaxID=2642485 RepID=UPI002577175A|nr:MULTISPECIES: T9SS type A sorting domain-containing protein [unclassified Myroides]MDM1043606.1 T9SS type A sorting domain-containing protein [Myroides sp. R163-1]MDM1054344.1 T9SS type A sorting domain-containing protein [Myroides sp. 1354]MDM1067640.1 T9SS type A sorting domain-containing protein [Myroides sp. 1372]
MRKILLLLFLLLCSSGSYAQMINDFEQGFTSIPLNSAVYRNQNNIAFNVVECNIGATFGSVFTPPSLLNNAAAKASIMTAINEPILSSYGIAYPCVGPNGGKYSLRLNNQGGGQDITSYTQTFRPTSKYLSFDYLAVLNSPHITQDDVQPFFTVRLLDVNNNIISSVPFCAKASLNDLILTKVNNHLFYTEDFYCQTIVIPEEYVNRKDIKVQFVIADCGWGGDVGVVYLDNIRMGDPCNESQFGFIDLNPNDNVCNPEKVTITGTYNAPLGTTYTSSNIKILDSNGNPVFINPSNITLNHFSGGTFSYSIAFPNLLPRGRYEVKVEAVFTNTIGYTYLLEAESTNEGADISVTDPGPLTLAIAHDPYWGMTPGGSGFVRWDDAGGPYTVEYVYDGYCCLGAYFPSLVTGQIYSIQVNEPYLSHNAAPIIAVLGAKCMRIRVKASCTEWSTWCCISTHSWKDGGYDPRDPTDPFNICLDEIDLNNLSPEENFVAYPNPVSGTISIRNTNATQFTIYDLGQRVVKQVEVKVKQEEIKMDLSDLKKGMYILKTNQGEEIKILKD